MSVNSGDNQRQIVHNEETVQSGRPEQSTLSQAQSTTTDPTVGAVGPVPTAGQPVVRGANQSTVQTTSTSTAPTDQYIGRSVSDIAVAGHPTSSEQKTTVSDYAIPQTTAHTSSLLLSLMIRQHGYAQEQDGARVASLAVLTPAPD
jgi:hypothetical protein